MLGFIGKKVSNCQAIGYFGRAICFKTQQKNEQEKLKSTFEDDHPLSMACLGKYICGYQ